MTTMLIRPAATLGFRADLLLELKGKSCEVI